MPECGMATTATTATASTEVSNTAPTEMVDLSVASFKLTFECATAIRTLCDVMSNMLDTVEMHVWNTPEFSGLKIEAMTGNQISLVVGQLRAEVEMNCAHTAFCVNTKTLNTCVRSAPPHYALNIESDTGSSSVRLKAFETLSNTSIMRFTLPTLVCDAEPVRFKDIEYTTFIDCDTSELKSIVSMSLKLQGDTLNFKVQRPNESTDSAKRQRKERRHLVLTISSTGCCTQEHTFYSYLEDRGDNCVAGKCDAMANLPDTADLDTTFDEVYGARQLSDFLRSIDRQTVTLRLKQEKPLILHHKFGKEDSFVCLIVAPQVSME